MPPKKKEEVKEDLESKYQAILDKLSDLTTGRIADETKLNKILAQSSQLQDDLTDLGHEVSELKRRMEFINETTEDVQRDMEHKVDDNDFDRFKEEVDRKLDDLENRSKRNNLVFWNIPESEEKDSGCIRLLEDIMINHMKLRGADEIIIERAHRTGRWKRNRDGTEMPRPIYIADF